MTLQITSAAADRIKKIRLLEKNESLKLRIEILGGGCSGFQYLLNLVETVNADDTIFEKDQAEVIVDGSSLALLEESTLDFVEDLASSQFVISNPQATSKCGCGNSFSI